MTREISHVASTSCARGARLRDRGRRRLHARRRSRRTGAADAVAPSARDRLPLGTSRVAPPRAAGSATGSYRVDGGIFAGGAAGFHGSTGGAALNQPIVGIAATPRGNGYWLVASDGGIFSFGDAALPRLDRRDDAEPADRRHGRRRRPATATGWSRPTAASSPSATRTFYGSTGAMTPQPAHRRHGRDPVRQRLLARRRPTAASSPSATPLPRLDRRHRTSTSRSSAWPRRPSGNGYWLVAADGGIFSFGDATFHGSDRARRLNRPSSAGRDPAGNGYWFVAADGGVFAYGDAHSSRGPASTAAQFEQARSSGIAAVGTEPPRRRPRSRDQPRVHNPAECDGDRRRRTSTPSPSVTVLDNAGGTPVTTDTSAVTLAITTSPADATLALSHRNPPPRSPASRRSRAATIDTVGTYTLTATRRQAASAASRSRRRSAVGAADHLEFTNSASGRVDRAGPRSTTATRRQGPRRRWQHRSPVTNPITLTDHPAPAARPSRARTNPQGRLSAEHRRPSPAADSTGSAGTLHPPRRDRWR